LLISACLIALSSACAPVSQSNAPTARVFSESDRDAVLGVLEGQRAAWNSGDLAAYMAGYERSEKLVFTSGAKIRRGWQETHDKYEARYGGDSSTMGHLEFRIDELRPIGADGAVVLGHWELTETEQAGSGVFSVILLRGDEGWKVIHDHTSSDPD
jgi:ketosteroid isomerase-like protein